MIVWLSGMDQPHPAPLLHRILVRAVLHCLHVWA